MCRRLAARTLIDAGVLDLRAIDVVAVLALALAASAGPRYEISDFTPLPPTVNVSAPATTYV